MKTTVSLVALGAMFALSVFGGSSALATDKKPETKQEPTEVKVQTGDTLEKIATAHGRTYVQLYNANAGLVSPDLINEGDTIRIPKDDEQLPDRFSEYQAAAQAAAAQAAATYRAPAAGYASTPSRSYTTAPVNSSSYYVGNGMWCTDYVASKRSDIRVYGNAGYNWVSAAQAEGKATGTTPQAGAVAVTNGHVAYVEGVNADGSYTVSEMGWNYQAGNFNKRTVQPGAFGQFIY